MANQKISDLTATNAQSGDVVPVLRGGGNAAAYLGNMADDIENQRNVVGTIQMNAAVNHAQSLLDLGDEFSDVFTDETGVNTVGSTNILYDAGSDYYKSNYYPNRGLVVQSLGESDAGTTFVDSTGTNTLTPNGDVEHSTDQTYFDTSSIKFDGAGDYISLPDDPSVDITTDFTVEAFVYQTSSTGWRPVFESTNYNASSLGMTMGINSGKVRFTTTEGGTLNFFDSTTTLTNNTWYHIACVKEGSTKRIFVNGVLESSATEAGTIDCGTSGYSVGSYNGGSYFAGYMEDVAVSLVAHYSANFTPRTAAMNVSGNNDFTLLTAKQDVSANPSKGFIVVRHEAIDSVTMNTDFTAKISIDNGSTYTSAVTFTFFSVYDADSDIYVSGEVDLSAQTGSELIIKYETANNKDQRIHGHYFGVAS